jgi:hypothetical protein
MKNHNYQIACRNEIENITYIIKSSSEDAEFDSLVISIDKNQMIFKQVLICFNENFKLSGQTETPRFLLMNYYNYKYEKEINLRNDFFDTGKYITNKDARITVKKEYEKYHVVNNLNSKISTD